VRLALQPYITLLEMHYPLDDYTVRAEENRRPRLRSEASNARRRPAGMKMRFFKAEKPPKRQHVFVAVHRSENDIYFKRLSHRNIYCSRTCATARRSPSRATWPCAGADAKIDWSTRIQQWFKLWTEMGWFCRPGKATKGPP